MVVPLLNGVDHIEVLRQRFGADRVVPATIAVEAERVAPGQFVQRSPFVRLNLAASGEAAVGSDCRAPGRDGIHLPVHAKRADVALEQAVLPGAFRAGDIGFGKEQGRGVRRPGVEAQAGFRDC